MHRSLPTWWLAPIGISFYALQLIAYDVDVYRGTASAQKNYFKFLLFASFFPQIIQGPIPRYNQLSHQLVDGNRFDEEKFVRGFQLILWGFFLKLCIADKAGVVVDTVFDNCQTYRGGVRLNCRNTL
jgi:D-alanyl-lipoteichoic acid acyltransferase DltB (MBOAT superfamily)